MTDEGNNKIIYPELSYEIVGALFDVFNDLGYGLQEKYYYRAIAQELKNRGLNFKSQAPIKLDYRGSKIGFYLVDFIIEEKIILEIKKGNFFARTNIEQVKAYLHTSGLKLAILANFTEQGVKFKRILNIK